MALKWLSARVKNANLIMSRVLIKVDVCKGTAVSYSLLECALLAQKW